MTAKNLLKSLALTPGINLDEIKVISLYKNQDPDVFLVDNFTDKIVRDCTPKLSVPMVLDHKDYLVVSCTLDSPDGKSTINPDYYVTLADSKIGEETVYVYKID